MQRVLCIRQSEKQQERHWQPDIYVATMYHRACGFLNKDVKRDEDPKDMSGEQLMEQPKTEDLEAIVMAYNRHERSRSVRLILGGCGILISLSFVGCFAAWYFGVDWQVVKHVASLLAVVVLGYSFMLWPSKLTLAEYKEFRHRELKQQLLKNGEK